jgi:hypothetical protein
MTNDDNHPNQSGGVPNNEDAPAPPSAGAEFKRWLAAA